MAKSGNTPLELHRQAWLDAHPERDVEWLLRMAKEGFDIHHIDGDHENDDPLNLVLIEHRDHFMLHSGKRQALGRLSNRVEPVNRPPCWWDERPAKYIRPTEKETMKQRAVANYERVQRALVDRCERESPTLRGGLP